ncbi:hypothetical protein [Aeoliella sp.]|uniref:hypothetical protein n=1 Tax=Aeoliella sp. TaxID=2795800 RepID=UPI003CCC306A
MITSIYTRSLTLALATALGIAPACIASDNQSASTKAATELQIALQSPNMVDDASRALLEDYFDSILAWGQIVQTKVIPVPGQPDSLFIGRPRNGENDVRATAYSAMVLAFLAEANPPTPRLSPEQRDTMREQATGLLRYLVLSHQANEGTCADGTQWGKQWQSALWTRAVGFTAWQLWPHLSDELREASENVIEFEADRFITQAPKSSLRNDTGAEENAWNGSICALACCMFPEHPQADKWDTAAKKYMYNTFSVEADAKDQTVGDDGKPVAEWVTTVNAHPDFTVENHRLVHIGYLKNSACMLQENASHWLLTGEPVPAACNHHVGEVFQVLASCMSWRGSAIYFAGNDWRLYETQCSDVILYNMLARTVGNREAAYLERVALDSIAERQQVEDGFYNGRRDLEYGGLCATRLIGCYLTHATATSGLEVASEDEFEQFASGVRHLTAAKSVVHRTPSKFASFSWAQQRMALTLPKKDTVVWPHYHSNLGVIDNRGASQRHSKLRHLELDQQENSFRVTGSLDRADDKVVQDFYFASPAADYTVYVERIRIAEGHTVNRRWTGLIGVQPSLGDEAVSIQTADGEFKLLSKGGEKQSHRFVSDWLNVGGSIGYVVKRSTTTPNEILVQDKIEFDARRPHLQEWVSLVANDEPLAGPTEDWACVVALPNSDAAQTRKARNQVRFEVHGDTATVTVFGDTYAVDFGDGSTE